MDTNCESRKLQLIYEQIQYTDWKKVGEVYRSRQSQCYLICSICSQYGNIKAFDMNDVSMFWNHLQQEHLSINTFSGTKNAEYLHLNNKSTQNIRNIADATNLSDNLQSINISQEVRSPTDEVEKNLKDLYETTCYNQAVIRSEHASTLNNGVLDYIDDEETVHISDDENEDFSGKIHSYHQSNTIEMPDEDDVTRIEFNNSQSAIENVSRLSPSTNSSIPSEKSAQQTSEIEVPPCNTADITNGYIQDYRCRDCRNSFHSVLELEKHQRTHLPIIERREKRPSPNVMKCILCQNMVLESDLPQHMSREHSIYDHPVLTNMVLSEMIRSEDTTLPTDGKQSRQRPFKCVLCGKRTASMKSMIVHHHRFHSEGSDAKTTRCGICQKLILTANMRLHVSTVHGRLGKFSCKTCYISFKGRFPLKQHMDQFHREHPQHSIQLEEDKPPSSSPSTQPKLTSEERSYLFQLFTKHSQEKMNEILCIDDSDDDDIPYGEIIPPVK